MAKDPFIKVLFEQTGHETVVRQSYYDRYPSNMRHLGLYEDQSGVEEEAPAKPKEPTRQDLMDQCTIKGLTFASNANKAELKALLEED